MATKPHLPPDKYRGFRITTRFTEPEYIALSNLAKTQEMNVADFIRKCVKEWAQHKKQTQRKGLSDTC
jgi:hypothetical protein